VDPYLERHIPFGKVLPTFNPAFRAPSYTAPGPRRGPLERTDDQVRRRGYWVFGKVPSLKWADPEVTPSS
jgi:hypothetical protein